MKQLFQINFHIFHDPVEYSFDFMDHEENSIYGPIALEDLESEELLALNRAIETLKSTIKAMEQNDTNKTPY